MRLFESALYHFPDICRTNTPLGPRTTLKVGGTCPILFQPTRLGELQDVMIWLERRSIPVFILGGGSNLLIDDGGIDGAVVSLSKMRGIEFGEHAARVEAGYPLARLVWTICHKGWSGTEGLVGIPGTVGGATFMNAGGHEREMADLIVAVETVDMAGRYEKLDASQIEFSYRRAHLGERLVVATHLRFFEREAEAIKAEAEENLQRKRDSQPLKEKSSGCIFKNPPDDSAGRLIDAAGCKGLELGGAQVSTRHANFIVNRESATAADVLGLITMVQAMVRHQFGVALELEVQRPACRMMLRRAG